MLWAEHQFEFFYYKYSSKIKDHQDQLQNSFQKLSTWEQVSKLIQLTVKAFGYL